MDYSLFTEEIFDERYNLMPGSLRAVFESEQTKKILANIEREHYLNPDKSVILEQLVGLTLMGFISLRGFSREVSEQLFLNFEHAQVLSNEIYNRLFAAYEEDLNDSYKPIEEVLAEKERIQEAINTPIDTKESTTQIKNEEIIKPDFFSRETKDTPIKIETSEEAPLILHEEPSFFSSTKEEKRPETPFNRFIPSSAESTEKKAPRAKIESGPNPFSFLKPDEKTTVHYSEIRTGLKPEIGPESEVISIGAIEKMSERNSLTDNNIQQPQKQNIEIKDPEIINITPRTSEKIEIKDSPILEKKKSWISNIFSSKEINQQPNTFPQVTINEQKPDSQVVQGNTINLK